MMYAEEIVGSEDEKMSEASSSSVNSSLVVSCSKGALVSDSTDFDSSSTGNSSGGSQKKRKRRTEGKDKFHRASLEMEVKRAIPKSVTPDVRYTYTGLLAHVYNSCDYDLMYQFLHTYYRQDFILQQELTGNFPDALKGLIEVRGRTLAGKYWYERMHDSPDVVFRIEHVNIIINDETMNGIIQCKFNLQGSQIMNAMDPVFNPSMMTTDQDKKIITLTDEDDHVLDTDKHSNGEDFDAILDGATELDFGFHEIPSASLTDTKFLPDDQAETFAINPVNQFYHNVSDALQKRDEFAGLKVPKVETKPVLLLNKAPSQQGRIMTIHYNYQGAVEMHFDADSLIYYSKFVLCNL